jgi:hypothetical protein
MKREYKVLILGASYGSLLATKLVLAGHQVKMVCLPAEAELFNSEGAVVRMPVKGTVDLVQIESKNFPGKLSAGGPGEVDPRAYDLVALAMQEPQYRSPGVRELLDSIGRARVPCISIMNMPPLPYLQRIPGLDVDALRSAYTDPSVWDSFDPAFITLCSPDPQAFRPPEEKANVLQVRLPTNFKAARFDSAHHTEILRDLQSDIEGIRFETGKGQSIELPVKLKVHESVFVPLAKWSMLLAGNYRCVQEAGMRSIRDAVHSDLDLSRRIYAAVGEVCVSLGAAEDDLVPFEKYANAALSLKSPSSAARALASGACDIERVDRLVQLVARENCLEYEELDATVRVVDSWLQVNRNKRQESDARGKRSS